MTYLPLASSSAIEWPAVATSAGFSMVIGVFVVTIFSFGVVGAGQFMARRRGGGNGSLGLGLAVVCFAIAVACVAGGIYLLIDKVGS